MKVVVVGAGIAGLAAAWELTQSGGCDVTLLESERRAGGVIVTEQMDGFIVDGGPDGFLAGEPELPALARELGISDHVVRQVARGTSLWTGKALQPIDEGQAAALLGIDAAQAEVAKGFSTFAEGMAEPVAALAQRLAGSLRFAQGVAGIVAEANRWRIAITGGSAHEAGGVVHGRALAEVVYAPSITVSLAYREAQLAKPLAGAGFVVESPQQIRACTYASRKFPGRAPDGHVLLLAYLSSMNGDPGAAAHAQLAAILGIRGEPLWSRAFYWDRGLPRYRAHHAEQVAAVRRRLSRLPPIAIAGAGYD